MSDLEQSSNLTGLEVAIIGMAGRFPGAKTIEQFWRNLQDGVESISVFSNNELRQSGLDPALLSDPNCIRASGVLEDIELFDAGFFGFSPHEASIMDPQQRIFLECTWEALEQAGYTAEKYIGAIGVYAGVGFNSYMLNNLDISRRLSGSAEQYRQVIGNDREFLSTRVSYKLNLTGPSFTIQSACSTSLVATHLACQGLISGECDLALAGGVSIRLPQKTVYTYQEGSIFAPDGHCRAFDARAQGTVVSSGAGVVVLKRLADALADGDSIYAVIKGSAVNNDGSLKAGYTAPSLEGQAKVIRAAQRVAEVEAETISYIEAHGTGTAMGDPIEVAALTQAFRISTGKKQFCAIGSLKSNMGHLDTAAGVAGVIKTALALKHKRIPPSLHFEQPNPNIDFANSPFYINTSLVEWRANGAPRRAGVSAFGFGGTNAHAILEEAPPGPPSIPSQPWQLLVLSARTRSALDTATANLAGYLRQHPDANLADVAYTLQVGRKEFGCRRALACRDRDDALAALESLDSKRVVTAQTNSRERPVIFMFPGQGAQHVQMASELYQAEPIFQEQVDRCAQLLIPHLGLDLRALLFPTADEAEMASGKLNQTAITQPALFTIEYALAHLWIAWGLRPQAMIGHSVGEYVAACLAEVFSLEDALALIAARGRMMQQLPPGSMLSVPLPAAKIQPLLRQDLSLAAINGATLCVVGGTTDAVSYLERQLAAYGIEGRRLPASHAFHSAMMDPILASFTAQVAQIRLQPPRRPYISNVTGTWITAAEATDPHYWARHLRGTVRFDDGLQVLLKQPDAVLLEVGPGQTLSTFAKRHPQKTDSHTILASLPQVRDQQPDLEFFLTTTGRLWLAGIPLDWPARFRYERRRRIALPTYPFERQRCWVEPKAWPGTRELPAYDDAQQEQSLEAQDTGVPDLLEGYAAPRTALEQSLVAIWQQLLGVARVGIHDNFFDLGGDSLLAIQLVANIREATLGELSSHTLLQAPTVAALAELIGQAAPADASDRSEPEHSLLVTLQPSGRKRPLFLIHPIGGGVYMYRDLAQQLGQDRPIYAIQAQGLDGKANPIPQVEQMAARYIEIIRAIQPDGPYLLAGSSFGGVVSFEIAQQLLALGRQVELLALIDSPDIVESAQRLTDDMIVVGAVLGAGANMPGLIEQMQQLPPEEQMRFCLEQAHTIENGVAEADLSEFRKLYQLLTIHFQALRSYQPHAYRGGEIVYFRAIEHDVLYPPNPERGWIELAPEGITIHEIPGNHISMNQFPHVKVLAGKLGRYLDRING